MYKFNPVTEVAASEVSHAYVVEEAYDIWEEWKRKSTQLLYLEMLIS